MREKLLVGYASLSQPQRQRASSIDFHILWSVVYVHITRNISGNSELTVSQILDQCSSFLRHDEKPSLKRHCPPTRGFSTASMLVNGCAFTSWHVVGENCQRAGLLTGKSFSFFKLSFSVQFRDKWKNVCGFGHLHWHRLSPDQKTTTFVSLFDLRTSPDRGVVWPLQDKKWLFFI